MRQTIAIMAINKGCCGITVPHYYHPLNIIITITIIIIIIIIINQLQISYPHITIISSPVDTPYTGFDNSNGVHHP